MEHHVSLALGPACLRGFIALTKPRVVALVVFTAAIGMLLATPDLLPWRILLCRLTGIWLVAGAAAAINCIVEQKVALRPWPIE